jgi:hypothetical protein
MELSDEFHAPATYPRGKQPPVPIGGWVDPRAGLGVVEKRKISCCYRESNPRREVNVELQSKVQENCFSEISMPITEIELGDASFSMPLHKFEV